MKNIRAWLETLLPVVRQQNPRNRRQGLRRHGPQQSEIASQTQIEYLEERRLLSVDNIAVKFEFAITKSTPNFAPDIEGGVGDYYFVVRLASSGFGPGQEIFNSRLNEIEVRNGNVNGIDALGEGRNVNGIRDASEDTNINIVLDAGDAFNQNGIRHCSALLAQKQRDPQYRQS